MVFAGVFPQEGDDYGPLREAMERLKLNDAALVYEPEQSPALGYGFRVGLLGMLHLEILKDRMEREYSVVTNSGRPMVAYHETVTDRATAIHVFDREFGGSRHFAKVALEVSAATRGAGTEIDVAVSDTQIPAAYKAAVRDGVTDGLMTGILARFPLTDVTVRITGGAFDPESSSEVAFRTAAVMALREAIMAASPEVLEPIMAVEVVTPADYMGEILSDVSQRRGKVQSMEAVGDLQVVKAAVPLAELFGYSTAVRSLSRGRASYTMEPTHFAVAPAVLKERLLNQ